MADILGTKHESLKVLVAEVLRHLPATDLEVLDWWDGDPHAIALALRSASERRVYVSSAPDTKWSYMLSCELTPKLDSDRYHNIESDPFTDINALATATACRAVAAASSAVATTDDANPQVPSTMTRTAYPVEIASVADCSEVSRMVRSADISR